jgi:hypothetical protein
MSKTQIVFDEARFQREPIIVSAETKPELSAHFDEAKKEAERRAKGHGFNGEPFDYSIKDWGGTVRVGYASNHGDGWDFAGARYLKKIGGYYASPMSIEVSGRSGAEFFLIRFDFDIVPKSAELPNITGGTDTGWRMNGGGGAEEFGRTDLGKLGD